MTAINQAVNHWQHGLGTIIEILDGEEGEGRCVRVQFPESGRSRILLEENLTDEDGTPLVTPSPLPTQTRARRSRSWQSVQTPTQSDTTLFDNWLRTVPVRIEIEAREADDAYVQAEYLECTGSHLTDVFGNLLSGYNIYRGGPNAVAERYGTIFRMKFPIPPASILRPTFISRLGNPVEYVVLRDGRMELASTDYIKYLLCRGFHVGNNLPASRSSSA